MADGPFFLPFSPVSCMLVMVPSVDKEVRAMTLLQMSYILEIDRCGSINRAAQNLFVSQSALSSAIAATASSNWQRGASWTAA